jgi:hypothetical protein
VATRPLRWLLPAVNLTGCLLFVLQRPPVPHAYLAEIDAVRSRGGMVINSAVSGIIACRHLYPWDEWHGGEARGVKVLEIANAPATAVVIGLDFLVGSNLAKRLPVCTWTWMLAGVFVALSSAQWWVIGVTTDAGWRRWRGGSHQKPPPA